MLIVPTYLGLSKINGIGLFADERITKGTVIWRLLLGFDAAFSVAEVAGWPENARATINRFAYLVKGEHWLCGDDARFINHSKVPNLSELDFETTVALRDIEQGEELTIDYYELCEDPEANGPLV